VPGFELNQYVDVAVRAKVVTKNGSEERKLPDMVAPTKIGNLLAVNRDTALFHSAAFLEP
jgi:hypothetical protein